MTGTQDQQPNSTDHSGTHTNLVRVPGISLVQTGRQVETLGGTRLEPSRGTRSVPLGRVPDRRSKRPGRWATWCRYRIRFSDLSSKSHSASASTWNCEAAI